MGRYRLSTKNLRNSLRFLDSLIPQISRHLLGVLIGGALSLASSGVLAQEISLDQLVSALQDFKSREDCQSTQPISENLIVVSPDWIDATPEYYALAQAAKSITKLVFPNVQTIEASQLGTLAKLQKSHDKQASDFVQRTLEQVDGPGVYLLTEFKNIGTVNLAKLVLWKIVRAGTANQLKCLSSTDILLPSTPPDDADPQQTNIANSGVYVQGNVTASDNAIVNIVNKISKFGATDVNIGNLEEALSAIATSPNAAALTELIPLKIAYKFSDSTILSLPSVPSRSRQYPGFDTRQIKFQDGIFNYVEKGGRIGWKKLELARKCENSDCTSSIPNNVDPIPVTISRFEGDVFLGASTYSDIINEAGCDKVALEEERFEEFLYLLCSLGFESNYTSYLFGRHAVGYEHSFLDAVPSILVQFDLSEDIEDFLREDQDQIRQRDKAKHYGSVDPKTIIENFIVDSYMNAQIPTGDIYKQNVPIDYYGQERSIAYILNHKRKYFSKWQMTSNTKLRNLRILQIANDLYDVAYLSDFYVKGRCSEISGIAQNNLHIEIKSETAYITLESSEVLKKWRKRLC